MVKPLHSESFVNLDVVSLQNDSGLVSNKHLFSILESSRTFPQDYDLSIVTGGFQP